MKTDVAVKANLPIIPHTFTPGIVVIPGAICRPSMDARVRQLATYTVLVLLLGIGTGAHAQDREGARVASRRPGPGALNLPPGATGPFRANSLSTQTVSPRPSAEEMEATKIIARVGDEVILAGDLYGQVNQFLHERLKDVPPEQRALITPEVLKERRWQLIRQVLPQVVDGKLIYLDFLRSIPEERIPDIQDSLFKAFDEQQLPVLVERANVQSAADLDAMLRSLGSSLDQQRRTFAEQLAAAQWRRQNGESRREVSHGDMLDYYRENIETYRIVAKVKWEQLSALDSMTLSRSASRKLVADMGNEVFRGASFAAVAKRSSQGPTASLGGIYNWTTRGSLRSTALDKAIFALPVGQLSRIIDDDDGCHIVRVIERQEESFVPFSEAQGEIRKKIKEERAAEAAQEYLSKLREDFPVWTIFDSDPEFAGG